MKVSKFRFGGIPVYLMYDSLNVFAGGRCNREVILEEVDNFTVI